MNNALTWRKQFALTVGAALLLSGCTPAGGHRFDYSRALLTMQCLGPGDRTVALAVHDVRKYIVNARHTPNYVGMSRAILGNPWPIYTADDAPLTNTMTQGLADALRKAGYSPLISGSRPTDTRQDVINALKSSRADRMILVTLNEWYSDSFRKGNYLTCYVAIEVLDREGTPMSQEKTFAMEEGIGVGEIPKEAEQHVLRAYKARFEAMLNHPDICKALQ